MKWSLRASVAAAAALGLLLLGAMGAVSYKSLRSLLAAHDTVEHTLEVLKASHRLSSTLKDVESGHRGYALSGDRRYLPDPSSPVPALMGQMRQLSADNPSQLKRLGAMEPLIADKLDWIAATIRLREKEGFGASSRVFKTNRGKVLMDQIEYLLEELQDEENRLLAERRARAGADARRAFQNLALLAALALLMAAGWGVLIERSIGLKEKSESALRDSEERLNLALDAAKMGIWEIDMRTGRATHTLRHDQIFGYEALQTDWSVGRFIKEHVASEHQAIVERAFAAARDASNASGAFRLECPITRKDGARRWILAEGTLFRDARGEPARMTGVISDVTDERDKAAALSAAYAQLEGANKELESFSYSVSHDLRAPLRLIDGFSQAVLEDSAGKLGPESAKDLGRVRAASQRMSRLIDDLLGLSRVTRAELRRTTVNLSALAESVARDLRSAEPGRAVDWIIAPGLAVEGDEGLLRVVLQNLMGNAWKFTSKTARARIEVSAFLQPDETPAYYVRDNGAGFDGAYAHKLFGAFQRLHGEEDYPGTGVGLATVARIISRHGGRTWAEGAPGRGATFYFTIPNQPERTS